MTNAETNDKTTTGAEQGAHVTPKQGTSKKACRRGPMLPRRRKASEARTNKKADVIAMMNCAKGVTLAEIVEATGWKKHTVRGFISILGRKGDEKIESSKNAAGERCYRIAK